MNGLSLLLLAAAVVASSVAEAAPRDSGYKRDDSPKPNDLFWANRGKKSGDADSLAESGEEKLFWPKPHSFVLPIWSTASRWQRREAEKRSQPVGYGSLRPNSFMAMYMKAAKQRGEGLGKRSADVDDYMRYLQLLAESEQY